MKKEIELIKIVEENTNNGRETAFQSLVALHRLFLKRYIESRIKDQRDAEEIYWDTYRKLYYWLVLGKRQYGETVKYMLKRIAQDFISNHWRKKKIIDYVDQLKTKNAVIPEADYAISKNYLKELLSRLPEKKRRTVELFYDGYSHDEIAKLVGWATPESSRSQLKKIRSHLSEQLKRLI